MEKKDTICAICRQAIKEKDAAFIFPKLPENFALSYMGGQKYHINCLKRQDIEEEFSKFLADKHENMLHAKDNALWRPLVKRDGNILVIANLDSKVTEVYDYEDFVDFSIPYRLLHKVLNLKNGEIVETISEKIQEIKLTENENIEVISKMNSVVLTKLTFPRLKKLIDISELEYYFDQTRIDELAKEYFKTFKSKNKKA